jgi:hypothetical protein
MNWKLGAALAASVGLSLAASQAQATVFTLDSFSVTANASDPGLVVNINKLQTTPLTFDLGATDPQTFDLFTVYTNESDVENGEDTVAKPISVSFTFSAPTPNQVDPVTGETYGDYDPILLFGFIYIGDYHAGELAWSNGGQAQMVYGDNLTGLMTITLNGGEFNEGAYGLNEGKKKGLKVRATFDWDRDPTPTTAVPEPATWALMIGGFGMAGAALRRRRALTA